MVTEAMALKGSMNQRPKGQCLGPRLGFRSKGFDLGQKAMVWALTPGLRLKVRVWSLKVQWDLGLKTEIEPQEFGQ